MLVSMCNSSNFLAMNEQSIYLMDKFCSCPVAKAVIDALAVPVEVEVGSKRIAVTFRQQENGIYAKAAIKIPIKADNSTKINNLAYEIFNTQKDNQEDLLALVLKGEIGMDHYALKKELHEANFIKKYVDLIQKCQEKWELDPEMLSGMREFVQLELEDQLMSQEAECHTDMYRLHWLDTFKGLYCQKHPNDFLSCKIKREELCDIYKLQEMPFEQRVDCRKKIMHSFFKIFRTGKKIL